MQETRAEAVMETQLPGPRPCTMCRSERSDRVKMLIVPRLGRIELSSREILAAVFECKLCGAVRMQPLHLAAATAA
jgi:hypothetical protein